MLKQGHCFSCIYITLMFTAMPSELILESARMLADWGMKIAFAESATAGRLAAEFSLAPQSGAILEGGVVCYDAEVKQRLLGLDKAFIERYTPESAEVTEAIARGLQKHFSANILVGITGLTTPGGSESEDKPVGTIFIHAIINGRSVPLRQVFEGQPEEIVIKAIDRVAQLIVDEFKEASNYSCNY